MGSRRADGHPCKRCGWRAPVGETYCDECKPWVARWGEPAESPASNSPRAKGESGTKWSTVLGVVVCTGVIALAGWAIHACDRAWQRELHPPPPPPPPPCVTAARPSAAQHIIAEQQPFLENLAVDASGIYWSTAGKNPAITTVAHDGGKSPTILARVAADDLTLDGTHVYWIQNTSIWRMPKIGGKPQFIGSAVRAPRALIVDANHIYWSDEKQIRRIPKSGGQSAIVIESDNDPESLVVADGYIYWINRNDIYRLSLGGGTQQAIKPRPHMQVFAIDVKETRLYSVINDGSIVVSALDGSNAVNVGSTYGVAKRLVNDGEVNFVVSRNYGRGRSSTKSIDVLPSTGGCPRTLLNTPDNQEFGATAVFRGSIYITLPEKGQVVRIGD